MIFLAIFHPYKIENSDELLNNIFPPDNITKEYIDFCRLRPKISETLPIIKNCDLYLGNDTGWLHIAAALKIKCLALFMDSPVQAYGKYSNFINFSGIPGVHICGV